MWPNPQEAADLVTFTEEIPNGKLHFLYSENAIVTQRLRASFSWNSNELRIVKKVV